MNKWCYACNKTLTLNDFYKCKSTKDGLASACKKCSVRLYKEYRHKNIEASREKKRKYYITYYAANRERLLLKAKNRKRNRPHERARDTLSKAVKRGHIKKPNKCSDCGFVLDKKKIHGHHHDYSKPLDVVWLCRSCHWKLHRKIGN